MRCPVRLRWIRRIWVMPGVVNVKDSIVSVKRSLKLMIWELLKACSPKRLLFAVRGALTCSRLLTPRSWVTSLVPNAAKRNVKSGRTSLDKKSFVAKKKTPANNVSYLTKLSKSLLKEPLNKVVIPISSSMQATITGNRVVNNNNRVIPRPPLIAGDQHRPHLITSEELRQDPLPPQLHTTPR